MNDYAKDLEKISLALFNLITKIEHDQAGLQVEQNDYESELQEYDPDDENTEEPEDPGKDGEIEELDNLLEELTSARNIINNI
jgi:hypothetical protein